MVILRRKFYARVPANKIKLRKFWINQGRNKILNHPKLRTPGTVLRNTGESSLIRMGRNEKYANEFFGNLPGIEFKTA